MRYPFFNFDSNGDRANGTPAFALFWGVTSGNISAPTITNVTTGCYYFDYVPTIDEVVFWEITLTNGKLNGIIDPFDDAGRLTATATELKRKQVKYNTATDLTGTRTVPANKPSHIRIDVNFSPTDIDFTTPDMTYYIVFDYTTIVATAPANQWIATVEPTERSWVFKAFP